MSNRLATLVQRIQRLPAPLASQALSLAVGRVVPFVGTSGLTIEEMSEGRVVVSTPNRRRVQNHIGGVHAAAMTLLAETATGLVVGMNVPDDRSPVVKELSVAFRKRTQGAMRAVAELSDEARAQIRGSERGDLPVTVRVTDESGREPIEATMIWAWTPKRRG